MVDLNPYGRKGCRCWPIELDHPADDPEDWHPAAECPFHGLLASYVPPPADTGTYRVVDLDLPSGRIVEHQQPAGCSCAGDDFDNLCAYCAAFWRKYDAWRDGHADHPHVPNADGEPVCTPDPPELVVQLVPNEEEQDTGVLAAVKRSVRRAYDALAGLWNGR